MLKKHHTKKPNLNHQPCINKGCNNFYNVLYRNTKEMCNPCRMKDKENEKRFSTQTER